jgi:hypothetical protein
MSLLQVAQDTLASEVLLHLVFAKSEFDILDSAFLSCKPINAFHDPVKPLP